ncbi:MAG: hypothetical protein LKE61_10585 [Erysipelotrichaceae bacterium]|jgi:hypothetical protein|nr:hypothetical protein [Erysipelotrichaceae bacterium]MCI1326848.1 hypothetical protein [Solobacterium sp.]MCH4043690.1 hypothetical protein [Erysipelotrichaceae bacterium]MCH4120909.1 hypothetical protein [Erysipelotrichaceae bacterium]MCI1363548.1 hypothetical protein [Solobacterium sp.]
MVRRSPSKAWYVKPFPLTPLSVPGNGFYHRYGLSSAYVPSTWAYCKLNVKNDAMVQDQLNTIKNKSVDYIVLSAQSTVPDILDENYELEAEKSQIVVNAPVTWRLYKRRK